ncbi:MAG: DUF4337 domain-containing protein [Siculibacillus sp.]|nr:DUF4337 domain-containing protein [Siculibacillus sp.]
MNDIGLGKSGESENERDQLNNLIAIAVAIASAFMAVSKIKNDSVVQSMQKAQAETADYWNEYQARRQRQFGVEPAIARTRAMTNVTAELEVMLAEWKKRADAFKARAEESSAKAKQRAADFEAGNDRDDLFDLSDTFLSVAIALLAVTAPVRIRWLFGVANVLAGDGMIFWFAGFGGWIWIEPSFLIAFLS